MNEQLKSSATSDAGQDKKPPLRIHVIPILETGSRFGVVIEPPLPDKGEALCESLVEQRVGPDRGPRQSAARFSYARTARTILNDSLATTMDVSNFPYQRSDQTHETMMQDAARDLGAAVNLLLNPANLYETTIIVPDLPQETQD